MTRRLGIRRDFALLAATLNKAAKRGADYGVDDEPQVRTTIPSTQGSEH